MTEIISLMLKLIITFLGFVAPIIVLLLSIFQAGLTRLRYQYENQRKQSESKLKEQLKASSEAESTDLQNIKNTIDELEKTKKRAITQLTILNPGNQLRKIFIPLFLSLIPLIIVQVFYKELINSSNIVKTNSIDYWISYILIFLSILLFFYSLYSIWKLLKVIIMVKANVDKEAEERENKKIELLSSLLSITSKAYLEKVYPVVSGKVINNNKKQIKLPINENCKLDIAISNSEEGMAKNVEIGFRFNYDFIIESSEDYSIFSDEDEQIIRFKIDMIQGETRFKVSPLSLTPIKSGTFDIKTFIKGENIPSKNYILQFIIE